MTDEELEKLHAARIELAQHAIWLARDLIAEDEPARAVGALLIADKQLAALQGGKSQ